MSKVGIRLVMAAVGLMLAGSVLANPTWTPSSPAPGPGSGAVTAQGKFTPPDPWTTTGEVTVEVWPVGGGKGIKKEFTLPRNQKGRIDWGPWKVTGLKSGQKYNVLVRIYVTDGKGKEVFYSPGIRDVIAP